MDMLESLCGEIARNGLSKIILLNGHGGNAPFLAYFVWKGMAAKRLFQLYCLRLEDWYSCPEKRDVPCLGPKRTFFADTERYFDGKELEEMLEGFHAFDARMIHEKYNKVFESLKT